MVSNAATHRPFQDSGAEPRDDQLAAVLGPTDPAFRRVLEIAAGFSRDWTFAGRSGWMLKIHAGGKALLYAIPLDGEFRVSMAIRDDERERLAGDPELSSLREAIMQSRRLPEGYGLVFDVSEEGLGVLEPFLRKLVAMRATPKAT